MRMKDLIAVFYLEGEGILDDSRQSSLEVKQQFSGIWSKHAFILLRP